MAKITIREVQILEDYFNLTVEFDFSLIEGGTAETYALRVSKPEYLYWKETAAAPNGVLDYVKFLVKPHYDKILAQKNLAVALALLNKEITW